MVELCPRCGYDFFEYIRKGLEADRCPNCFNDLRLLELEDWEMECKACGSHIVSKTYLNKKNGVENTECPDCGANLKETWLRFKTPQGKKCPYCSNGIENVLIEGNMNFNCRGAKQGNNYFIFNPHGNYTSVNVKCGNCGVILNNEMWDEMIALHQMLLSTFKVGDQ